MTEPAVPVTLASGANDVVARPQGCTNLKLRRLARVVGRHYDAELLAGAGITAPQYSLLSQVVHAGPMRPSDLAQALTLTPSSLTRNLQPLVERGWLEVQPGVDGRSRLVVATEAGRAHRASAKAAWKAAQLDLNDRLGPERVAQLHQIIDDCTRLLESP
jgi:DNA-binding MarR family transcriptional regulator